MSDGVSDGVSSRVRLEHPGARLARAAAVAVVVMAVVLPLAAVLVRSVWIDGEASTAALQRMLGSWRTWRLIGLTLAQALASTAATLVVGVPVAWVLSRYSFRGRKLVRTAAMVPFVLPSVVIGVAFATILGPRGIADLRGTWWAIIAAHLCFNLAVVLRVVGSAFDALDANLEDAARLMGASAWKSARQVSLPAVLPAVHSAAAIVFLYCLTSFGVIVLLGGGAVTTIEVEIWTRVTRQFDLAGAAVLAALQALTVVLVLSLRAPVGRARASRSALRRSQAPRTAIDRLLVAAAVVVVVVISVLPLLAILERSLLVGDSHGLAHWRSVGSVTEGTGLRISPWGSIGASLRAAIPAAAVALALGIPAARAVAGRPNGLGSRVLLLPLAISATTVGLGLVLLSTRGPVDFRRSAFLVVFAQMLVALPVVVRSLAPAMRAVPESFREAAELSGASWLKRTLSVELPLVRPALVAAAGLATVIALGEFGATVFVARLGEPTVPVAIERLMSRPGQAGLGQAMVLACVLGILCTVIVWTIDAVSGSDAGVSLGE